MITDKTSQDDKATNRKRQAVNGFSATKNSDHIKQLESRPPKGNWHRFDSIDIRAAEIGPGRFHGIRGIGGICGKS